MKRQPKGDAGRVTILRSCVYYYNISDVMRSLTTSILIAPVSAVVFRVASFGRCHAHPHGALELVRSTRWK